MTKENLHIYFTGTAGAGKSTMTQAYAQWCQLRGLDAITVNLDPGAERLPYTPDVDIRDWVKLEDVMREHNLGPNGAQVAAADLIAIQLAEIREEVHTFRSDFVLIDTPGQIELFVFRESGRYVVSNLAPDRSLVAFLLDPFLARTPNGFASQLMLAVTTEFRLQVPLVHVLSKADVLSFEDLAQIEDWTQDADALWMALEEESPDMQRKLAEDIVRTLTELGAVPRLHHVSSLSMEGCEDIYEAVTETFLGGEDVMKD
jgi:GPN-loop GTPase